MAKMILLLAACLLFLVLGWNFGHGKCLNLIVGNTFARPNEYGSPKQKRLGRIMSKVMYVGSGVIFVNALYAFCSHFEFEALSAALGVATGIGYLLLLLAVAWAVRKSITLYKK